MRDLRVALIYDRINKWGGAERVLLALHKLFPDAPLYTSVYNKETAPWADVFDPSMDSAGSPQAGSGQGVRASFLQKIPFIQASHELLAPFMPLAFETFTFDNYDVVISVTSEAAKGIITKPSTLHICYCLTPTRYLWSGYEDYFRNASSRFLAKPVISYLRAWDKIASQRPDAYVAISKEVQSRIARYYNRKSTVIYPPVEISNIKYQISKSNIKNQREDYFLIVSRLVPYKRIDIAIQACTQLKLPLKIIGIGSEEKKLKALAGPTIEFLGTVTDEELSYYYKNAEALIFPGVEDFGLVMAEAQSFGTPIVAFRGGGAREIVVEGKTGAFFDKQNPQSLIALLEKFDKRRYNREDCMGNAERFSYKRFEKEFTEFFNKAIKQYLPK